MLVRKTVFLAIFALASLNIYAQTTALDFIDQADLKKHLTYIASDELMGRKLGAEDNGLEKTANYLAEQAEKIGLKPVGKNYFQEVKVFSVKPAEDNYMEIVNEEEKSVFKSSSVINLNNTKGIHGLLDEEIVFAGFGTDGFADLNLNDKIVVVSQGNTESFNQESNIRWNNRLERAKIEKLSGKSPKLLILVTTPRDEENKTFNQIKVWFSRTRFQLESPEENTEVPVIITTPDFADALLDGKGKYKDYLAEVQNQKTVKLFQVENRKINFNIEVITEQVDAKNVMGIVEGSDPKLKEECVVIMAHYDHLGVDTNGDVFNGADDNGSGTVTLLEVAEAFSTLGQKPKRSILFLWVTGEEAGLLGSQYYVEHSFFPLEKTKACINIDMDGRVFEPRDTVWKRSPKMVKNFDELFTLTNDVWPGLQEINSRICEELNILPDYSLPENFLRSSDHYSFHSKGVPILNYATGYHADYHKVTDEVDKINFDKMKRVADLTFLVAFEIANQETNDLEIIK